MDDVAKVEVASSVPIPVSVIEDKTTSGPRRQPLQNQRNDPSVAATTTFEENLNTAGQRNINLIWETNQAKIATFVIVGTMMIDGLSVLLSLSLGKDFTAAQALAIGFVNSLATGVVSFYFSRTNHAAIGGIGVQADPNPYRGR